VVYKHTAKGKIEKTYHFQAKTLRRLGFPYCSVNIGSCTLANTPWPTTPPNVLFKVDKMYFSSYLFFQGVVLNQISGMGSHQDKKMFDTLLT
jgi:hypothetical protein